MISIKLNGIDYVNFEDAEVFRSMETASGAFRFTSSADGNNLFPIKIRDKVDISVDGTKVIDGYIETINSEYSATEHSITVTGRDVTSDFIDSTVGSKKEFLGTIQLIDIIRAILDGLGLSSIGITDETGGIEPFFFYDNTSAEIGQTCFDFIEPYLRKRQVLLITDGSGNLILTRASSDIFPVKLQNVVGESRNENNITSGSMTLDFSNRFNQYIARSQLNPMLLTNDKTPQDIADQSGESSIDNQIRTTRILEFNCEESSDNETAKERAEWESNVRRAKSLSYSATIPGHSTNAGDVYKPNVLIEVNDDFADLKDFVFVRSVTYIQDIYSGTLTTFEMTYKDAYKLEAVGLARDSETDELSGWFS